MVKAIVIFSGLAAFCFFWGGYLVLTEKRRAIRQRVQKFAQVVQETEHEAQHYTNKNNPWQRFLGIMGRVSAPRKVIANVEEELLKADLPLRGEEYIALTLVLFAGGGLFGYLINGQGAGIVFGALGLICPVIFLQRKKRLRLDKMNRQIGDCLTVMINSLKAGFSFQQTMDQVSKEMSGPLGMEFGRTTREISLGMTAEEALKNMGRRLESDDIDLMITAILIQRQSGGNLAEILENIAETLRERVRIKGEIKTLTAQGRISGWIVGLLPLVLFAIMLVISPGYMEVFFESRTGLFLLVGGVVSQLFGVMVIKKIVDIDI